MRVLYDHQTFELQDFGGISRYFVELLRNCVGFEVDLALKRSSNIHLSPDDPLCQGVRGSRRCFFTGVGWSPLSEFGRAPQAEGRSELMWVG